MYTTFDEILKSFIKQMEKIKVNHIPFFLHKYQYVNSLADIYALNLTICHEIFFK